MIMASAPIPHDFKVFRAASNLLHLLAYCLIYKNHGLQQGVAELYGLLVIVGGGRNIVSLRIIDTDVF